MIVSGRNNSCWGTNVPGHKRVWAQIKCVGAQTCPGTNVSGHNRVGTIESAQLCGLMYVWAQTWGLRNKLYSGKINIAERHHVVYQYICPRDERNSTQSYIGYTTSSVANRFRMHTQNMPKTRIT